MINPALLERFHKATLTLTGPDPGPFGLAVSGGPDSMAMLLLAHAAFPGQVHAATVDHGLRPEAVEEAAMVSALCQRLHIPHHTLGICGTDGLITRELVKPRSGMQAWARGFRYSHLRNWCEKEGLRWLLTAHHADDQAETLLMRIARGSGVAGLSGIRPIRLDDNARHRIVRPLLAFSKAELVEICTAAGVDVVHDPSNHDPRHDRTAARALLAGTDWLLPHRLAAVAQNCRDAEEALAWSAGHEWERRMDPRSTQARLMLNFAGLPREILWRLVSFAILDVSVYATAGGYSPHDGGPDGPDLMRLIDRVQAGQQSTLCAAIVRRRDDLWFFLSAPPHRLH